MKPILLALLVAVAVSVPSFGADTSRLNVTQRVLLIDLELWLEQYKQIRTEVMQIEKERRLLLAATTESKEEKRRYDEIEKRRDTLHELAVEARQRAEDIGRALTNMSEASDKSVKDGGASGK